MALGIILLATLAANIAALAAAISGAGFLGSVGSYFGAGFATIALLVLRQLLYSTVAIPAGRA